jgi:hypothetical protein
MKSANVFRVGLVAGTLMVLLAASVAAQDPAYVAQITEEARSLDPKSGLGFDPFELTPEELLRSGKLTQLRHKLLTLRACAQTGAQSQGVVLSSTDEQKRLVESWTDAAFDPQQGALQLLSDARMWAEMRKMVLGWKFYCAATQSDDARRDSDLCYASCSLRVANCENNCLKWGPPAPGCLDHCDWAFNTCLFGCIFFF